jgi:phenylpropionate dioxygenase-like ring-hydroxylating dioxygenase large terminal subunit
MQEYGLTPIEAEVWMGFVFVRFRAGGPSVAERMAHYAPELEPYRFADMVPAGDIWKAEPGVDWKNVMDNYLEGYHVPVGHPGLYRLFGVGYETDVRPGHVSRAMHWLRDKPSDNWSESRYQSLLPEIEHLSADRRRAWAYYTLLPNIAFDVYPDQIDFFHVVPTGPGKCRIRSRAYRLPNPSPTLKAVQYLNWRINAQVQNEDEELIRSVQEGLGSESYGSGILSEKEMCLAQMHDYVRSVLPVSTLPVPPAPGTMGIVNAAMIKEAA